MPATAASAAPDDEGERDGAVDVDAEQRGHPQVLLAGALGAAQRGAGGSGGKNPTISTTVTARRSIWM